MKRPPYSRNAFRPTLVFTWKQDDAVREPERDATPRETVIIEKHDRRVLAGIRRITTSRGFSSDWESPSFVMSAKQPVLATRVIIAIAARMSEIGRRFDKSVPAAGKAPHGALV